MTIETPTHDGDNYGSKELFDIPFHDHASFRELDGIEDLKLKYLNLMIDCKPKNSLISFPLLKEYET